MSPTEAVEAADAHESLDVRGVAATRPPADGGEPGEEHVSSPARPSRRRGSDERGSGGGGDDLAAAPCDRNEVRLVGRLSAAPETRVLPSGDVLTTFRVVLRRPPESAPGARAARRRVTVDTIDCAAWQASVQEQVQEWSAGEMVDVEGCLRRRFWRAGAGAASRTEVEVVRARRIPPDAGP